MPKKKGPQRPLLEAIKQLIHTGTVATQEDLVSQLGDLGYEVNQSKISRSLRKLMVMKVKNDQGQTVYALPKEPIPPSTQSPLSQLVLDITANESLIVVRTSPGSASLLARLLDYHQEKSQILGTLAGDDTIFIAPKSIKNIAQALQEVKDSLLSITA